MKSVDIKPDSYIVLIAPIPRLNLTPKHTFQVFAATDAGYLLRDNKGGFIEIFATEADLFISLYQHLTERFPDWEKLRNCTPRETNTMMRLYEESEKRRSEFIEDERLEIDLDSQD